jgi:hypothetical protein
MYRKPRETRNPRPQRSAAWRGWLVLAALAVVAAAPLSAPLAAQSQLVILDTEFINGSLPASATAPKVGRLSDDRFVTVQRAPWVFGLLRLELRSWQLGSTGNLTLLHTFYDTALGNQDVEQVVGLSSGRFVTALRPTPTTVRLASWNVSSSGVISKLDVETASHGVTGKVDLATASSGQIFLSRVVGLLPGNAANSVAFMQWDIDFAGQVSNGVVVSLLPDATDNAIATYGQGDVAVAQRLTSGNLRVAHYAYAPTVPSLTQVTVASGPAVTAVDITYNGSGRIVTACRLASGGAVQVAGWTELNFPPYGKFLYSPSSAQSSGAVSAVALDRLYSSRVATAVLNSSGKVELLSWETGGTVSLLDQLAGTSASTLSFTRLSNNELVTATKATSNTQVVTAWSDLVPDT